MKCSNPSEFALRVAVAMDDLKSSHVYFVLQKAYGEGLDWSDAQKTMDGVIALCDCSKCRKIKRQVQRTLK